MFFKFSISSRNNSKVVADYMLAFELWYIDINSLRISYFDLDFIKTRLWYSAFSSYKETSKFIENNLPKAEFDAPKFLIRNTELIRSESW